MGSSNPLDAPSLLVDALRSGEAEFQRISKEETKNEVESIYNWFEDIEKAGHVDAALFSYYQDDESYVYEPDSEASQKYPILTTDSWLTPNPDLNSVLGDFETIQERWDREEQDFVDLLRRWKQYHEWDPNEEELAAVNPDDLLWDQDCYRLINCQDDNTSLDFEITNYYSYVRDCEQIAYELYDVFHQNGITEETPEEEVAALAESEFPHRDRRAADFSALKKCENHYYKLGLNVYSVFQNPDGNYRHFLLKRSDSVAEFPKRYHVAPAGSFQPHHGGYREEFNLEHLVFREFGEEILKIDDLEGNKDQGRAGTKHWFKNDPEVRDLVSSVNGKNGHLYYTGFGFDLLTAKPEMTALLFIDDSDWAENHWSKVKFNWEFAPRNMVTPLDENSLGKVLEYVAPNNVVPAGAMAFYEGHEVLREVFDLDFLS